MRISVIIISDSDSLLKFTFEDYNPFQLEIRENYSVFFNSFKF